MLYSTTPGSVSGFVLPKTTKKKNNMKKISTTTAAQLNKGRNQKLLLKTFYFFSFRFVLSAPLESLAQRENSVLVHCLRSWNTKKEKRKIKEKLIFEPGNTEMWITFLPRKRDDCWWYPDNNNIGDDDDDTKRQNNNSNKKNWKKEPRLNAKGMTDK